MRRHILYIAGACCCVPLLFLQAMAQVTVTWLPNTEPDLAGYRVYHGRASGSYEAFVSVADTVLVFRGLSAGRHFFAVTAYDDAGNESGFSEEVSALLAAPDPPQQDTLQVRSWPAGKPIRLLLVWKTQPGPADSLAVEWRQFDETYQGNWSALHERAPGSVPETDYWTRGDTLVLNTARLQTFNPELRFRWRFRVRVNQGVWVYAPQAVRIIQPGELERIIILE